MVFSNPRRLCMSVAMAVLNGIGFRVVADYRVVNQLVVRAAMLISQFEERGICCWE